MKRLLKPLKGILLSIALVVSTILLFNRENGVFLNDMLNIIWLLCMVGVVDYIDSLFPTRSSND